MSLLAVLWTTSRAQDPVKASPQYYKVLLENDQVRVLEYRLKAGDKEPERRFGVIRPRTRWKMSAVLRPMP
jgi:hypothetical protein